MTRRLRRLPALLLPIALVAGAAGACGNDSSTGSSSPTGAMSAVAVSGKEGEAPQVTYKKQMNAATVETKELVKGSGETIQDGDQVSAHIYIGNGYTQKKAFSTYDNGGKPQQLTVNSQLSPVFADALKGRTVGSRLEVTAPADKAFGQGGNPQLGIGNKDSVLLLIDLIGKSKVLDKPEGADRKAPSWAPTLKTSGDKVTALDFAGAPKPDGKLRSAVLIQGTGATVQKGQSITVNYLGQVYGGKKPFDESYGRGEPTSFQIGAGAVISGWDKTLVGQKIGSRVLLEIPPAEGYGKAGQPQAGIKGTDTLYFVVDILAAS